MSLVGRCVLKVTFGSALKLVSFPSLWPPVIAQPSVVFGNPAILALHVCEPHLVKANQEGPDHSSLKGTA